MILLSLQMLNNLKTKPECLSLLELYIPDFKMGYHTAPMETFKTFCMACTHHRKRQQTLTN